jgi:hypothetical protein
MSKTLYTVSNALNNQDTTPVDFAQITNRVEQQGAGLIHAQNTIADAAHKLDDAISALERLYRSLSKLTL